MAKKSCRFCGGSEGDLQRVRYSPPPSKGVGGGRMALQGEKWVSYHHHECLADAERASGARNFNDRRR